MENKEQVTIFPKEARLEMPPSLFKYIAAKSLSGFDTVGNGGTQSPSSGMPVPLSEASGVSATTEHHHHSHSISISMPSSPSGLRMETAQMVVLGSNEAFSNRKSNLSADPSAARPPKAKFHSQPMLTGGDSQGKAPDDGKKPEGSSESQLQRCARSEIVKDKRFDSFKTWSGRLERQLSNLRGKPQEEASDDAAGRGAQSTETEPVPVDRYFDALEGPELDTLRASEELLLPEDKKWPFLLRFPISSFGICLGVSSQAILWKTLASSKSTVFLHVSPTVNMVLWCTALLLMAAVTATYALKVTFYFEAVRREYYHPVRVNFFFAPWIACLFLVLGAPPSVAGRVHAAAWYALMAPILCLELKIYGQWMSGGQRRLSKVANPSNHLSIVGNFVGALLGAQMGLREGPIFFFAVGLAHYTVLFVTLYQRLPTNETLPKELHPVFFLFVAAPSVACTAWAAIRGDFDHGSRVAYFIAMFLYFSLAVRINFFRGFRFSLAWWAYTFPMTGAAIATIRYATEVRNPFTQSLTVLLSGISTVTVSALLVTTVLHAFVLRDLFPNDIAIAISDRKRKSSKRRTLLVTVGSADAKDLEAGSSPEASVRSRAAN